VIAEKPAVAERVLERIRGEGPLSSRDFERERGSATDWFGMPTNTVRALLEAYTLTGVLASRDATATAGTTASSSDCCRRSCFGEMSRFQNSSATRLAPLEA
jgi:hypothetical protein